MDALHNQILHQFQLVGEPISCERYGFGHINETYLVVTDQSLRYILQKINDHVFPHVDQLQHNIAAVTQYLRKQTEEKYGVLTLVPTLDGATYYHSEEVGYWRVYDFIEGSICLQMPETPEDFYQSAIAFGTFQQQLKDFPAHTLYETIQNFHNTPDRYRIFKEVLAKDPLGRAKDVQPEIEFALAHEEIGGSLYRMLQDGVLPLRVTHNDTKLNNVMLRADTRTPLCVIDLDTTMPGLSAYDFGDSIRFGAAVAKEDEQDLGRVYMSLDLFRIYTRGFLKACPGLTEKEKEVLPLGALIMTLECGVRFLTDYIDGDHYFNCYRNGQNVDRCRTQFKMVADMEKKWEEMAAIIREESLTI